jgi:multisubunit Na+/H+ antiporter MnhE subunit
MPRRFAFWLASWAALTGLYVLLVFKTEPAELVAGAICGAISATGAELVRRHGSVRFAPGWAWLPALARVPRATVVETALLVGVLWRVIVRREDVRGRIVSLPYPGARDKSVEATSRRVVDTWLGSVSPNSLVVGFAERHDRVLVHRLVESDRQ